MEQNHRNSNLILFLLKDHLEQRHTLLEHNVLFASHQDPGQPRATVAWEPRDGGAVAQLHWLAVEPQVRRLGLGQALMNAVIDRVDRLGCREIHVETARTQVEALGFYVAAGFRESRSSLGETP